MSAPPYDSLNLSRRSGDAPAAVAENWRRVGHALAERGVTVRDGVESAAWMRQVHGRDVLRARWRGRARAGATGAEADALVTDEVARPLVALAADCAPVALVGREAVGVVHAGWRGLVAGVVRAAVAALRARDAGPVRSVLGPCIRPAHYEFGEGALARAVERLGPEVAGRTDEGRPALDIPAAVAAELARAGVDDHRDLAIDTYASPDHFSHRRDGETGRQALVVIRRPDS